MKTNFVLLACSALLAGCHSAPVVTPLPDPIPLHGRPENYASQQIGKADGAPGEPAGKESEQLAAQRQIAEALIAQNDALTARLRGFEHPVPPTPIASGNPVTISAAVVTPVAPSNPKTPPPVAVPPAKVAEPAVIVARPPVPDAPLLTPNAEGVIDVTALDASAAGSPPNPFAVRSVQPGAAHETVFNVQGIVTGAVPSAVINEHLLEPGESVESLRLARIKPDAVILNGDGFALSLPLGTTKVRLPL